MKNILKNILVIISILTLNSCSNNSSDDGSGEIKDPTKSTLIYPDNNEPCTNGTIISDSETSIEFDWSESENTSSYILFVKNLNTDEVTETNASTDSKTITLTSGEPYSWYVVSKSNATANTATSDTWKFYLEGEGISNYAPFPADLLSPANKETINNTSVSLTWSGSDVDDDIKEYEVYLDTNTSPTTLVSTVTSGTLENQSVSTNTTYYWKVVTKDENNNSSTSQTYSFTVE